MDLTISLLQADSVPMENLSLYSGGGGGGQQNRMYPQGTHMVSVPSTTSILYMVGDGFPFPE